MQGAPAAAAAAGNPVRQDIIDYIESHGYTLKDPESLGFVRETARHATTPEARKAVISFFIRNAAMDEDPLQLPAMYEDLVEFVNQVPHIQYLQLKPLLFAFFFQSVVMMVQPVYDCIMELTAERHYDEIIYTAPDAPTFNQRMANELSLKENIMILCGHYKGIDQRVRDHLVTREISVGDYVLTGGELPACVMTDAIVRLIPGAMNDESSALSDSFQDNLLAPPVYTRPAEFNGWRVPDVLLSGHHGRIREWQEKMAYERTKALRPDLLEE